VRNSPRSPPGHRRAGLFCVDHFETAADPDPAPEGKSGGLCFCTKVTAVITRLRR
jgi:hypothetical protein